MGDQAKENLNIETDAGGMVNKIQKNFEIGKSKLNQQELEDLAKNNADLSNLEKKFENQTDQSTNNSVTNQGTQTNTKRKDGEERKKENTGEANKKRFEAGKSIIDQVNQPQSNIVTKGLQRIIKKIGGF